MLKTRVLWSLLLLLLAICPAGAWAQSFNSSLSGTVTDASPPPVVTVGGVDVPVSGINWSRSNTPVYSGVPVVISATDGSGNTRVVNIVAVF